MKYLKKALSFILYIIICSIIVLILGELVAKWLLDVRLQPKAPYDTAQEDELYGWKMTADYSFSGEMEDAEKKPYPVNLRYDKNGFKAFGDVDTDKPKVFFIGDSYTASVEVSNEKSFFNLLKDSVDMEVFAYGHAGWGTLQEYMFLKEQIELIQPDLVVWQTCANDFIDNHFSLELRSGYKVGERRPYWDKEGKLTYRKTPATTMEKITQISSFFKFVDKQWTKIKFRYLGEGNKVAEYFIARDGKEYEPYRASFEVTGKIMKEAVNHFKGKTKIVGFSADFYAPQSDDFKTIFESNDFEYSTLSSQKILSAQEGQKIVNSVDQYHWNELGHELVADGLLDLVRRNLLETDENDGN